MEKINSGIETGGEAKKTPSTIGNARTNTRLLVAGVMSSVIATGCATGHKMEEVNYPQPVVDTSSELVYKQPSLYQKPSYGNNGRSGVESNFKLASELSNTGRYSQIINKINKLPKDEKYFLWDMASLSKYNSKDLILNNSDVLNCDEGLFDDYAELNDDVGLRYLDEGDNANKLALVVETIYNVFDQYHLGNKDLVGLQTLQDLEGDDSIMPSSLNNFIQKKLENFPERDNIEEY